MRYSTPVEVEKDNNQNGVPSKAVQLNSDEPSPKIPKLFDQSYNQNQTSIIEKMCAVPDSWIEVNLFPKMNVIDLINTAFSFIGVNESVSKRIKEFLTVWDFKDWLKTYKLDTELDSSENLENHFPRFVIEIFRLIFEKLKKSLDSPGFDGYTGWKNQIDSVEFRKNVVVYYEMLSIFSKPTLKRFTVVYFFGGRSFMKDITSYMIRFGREIFDGELHSILDNETLVTSSGYDFLKFHDEDECAEKEYFFKITVVDAWNCGFLDLVYGVKDQREGGSFIRELMDMSCKHG